MTARVEQHPPLNALVGISVHFASHVLWEPLNTTLDSVLAKSVRTSRKTHITTQSLKTITVALTSVQMA